MPHGEKAKIVSRNLELAILLEVSAHKPGNVSVVTDFDHTRYEHFLASAVASADAFENAAYRGISILKDRNPASEAHVGYTIEACTRSIEAWQHGGNTLLGAVILLAPLAVSAGMSSNEHGSFEPKELRKNLKIVVESTTSEDAVHVYRAINIAKPSGLGSKPKLDVNDAASKETIRRSGITLYEVFKIASTYDMICREWTSDFPVVFNVAYPFLKKQLDRGANIGDGTIQTFLKVLSEYPDTFIARKAGTEEAERVTQMATQVLRSGGVQTSSGRKNLDKFDRNLRERSNLLNPGTTADIISMALALNLLNGYRP